jgi:heterotetrameric sarcosine oxidase gamma subunit
VSAPDVAATARPAGITLAATPADVVELAALRERAHVLKALAARRAVALPALGRVVAARNTVSLCVRPDRWLLLSAPTTAGMAASRWQQACTGMAAAVDQSSALLGLYLAGRKAREALARGCRLDLDPDVFPAGHAAATIIAQVAAILAALPAGMLILTPASTARHFREWLEGAARPFGLAAGPEVSVTALSGDSNS